MPTISKQTRAAIYDRDNHTCQRCGGIDNLTIDHIVPRSRGGTNRRSNLRTLCSPCNNSKGDSLPMPDELATAENEYLVAMRHGEFGRAVAEMVSRMRRR